MKYKKGTLLKSLINYENNYITIKIGDIITVYPSKKEPDHYEIKEDKNPECYWYYKFIEHQDRFISIRIITDWRGEFEK